MKPQPDKKTGSKALRYRESTIGGKKAANIMENQKEQFTAATLKRAGMATPAITGKLMMSGMGQRYLTNQAVAKPMSDPRRSLLEAMIRNSALSAAGGSR